MLAVSGGAVDVCASFPHHLAGQFWGLFGAFFVSFLLALVLRNVPLVGFVAALVFAASAGALAAPMLLPLLASPAGKRVLLLSAMETGGLFFGLSVFGFLFRERASRLGEFLLSGLLVLIVALVVSFFVHVPVLMLAISAVGVLVFSGYIVFDTARLAEAEYTETGTAVALGLFLDVLNLFQYLLFLNE
jgi:modulator of FtsH protease